MRACPERSRGESFAAEATPTTGRLVSVIVCEQNSQLYTGKNLTSCLWILYSMISGWIFASKTGKAEFFCRQGHGFEHSLDA